jgi:hypothetical protein
MPQQIKPATCNVVAHDIDCLCDVVVKTPTQIKVDPVNEGWCGLDIAEYLDLGTPWTEEKMLQFLHAQLMFHDEWSVLTRTARLNGAELNRRRTERKLNFTEEQMDELRHRVSKGSTAIQIRVLVNVMWGMDLVPSHAARLHRQLKEEL